MSTDPKVSRQVFSTQDQILSCWPAGIQYNANEDKYTYSVNASWKITPKSHLHVLDIDGAIGAGPYTLTIQLPIISQLPFSSRMYYFYLSNSQDQDVLRFIPTTGSGDVINGDPFNFDFTLDGRKKLFIALAVHGSYIIHEFGYSPPAPVPPVTYSVPLVCHRAVLPTPTGAITYTKGTFPSPADAWPASGFTAFYWTSDAFNPVPDVNVYNPGMDGYLTYAKPVPGQTLPGFVVNKTGLYRVTYEIKHLTFQTGIVNIQGNSAMGGCVVNVSSTGTYVDHFFFATSMAQGILNTQAVLVGCGSQVMHLNAGTSVCGGVNIPSSWTGAPTNVAAPSDYSCYVFELLRDDSLPPVAPLAFAEVAGLRSVNAGAVIESPMHAPLATSVIVSSQLKQAKDQLANSIAQQRQQQSVSSMSSFTPPAPSISLADIERIVQQALKAQANSYFVGVADTTEPMLMDSSVTVPVCRKRRRTQPPASAPVDSSSSSATPSEVIFEKEV